MAGVLVHDWMEGLGGAEKVQERMARLFPDADIMALWDDAPGRYDAGRVAESWLARTPLRGRKALSLPVMPLTWRTLGSRDADWILCASHLFAHHVHFSGRASAARKLVYAYTPARYIWEPEIDDRGRSPVVRAAAAALRPLDRRRAKEADEVAGISHFVAERIARTWNVPARVVYPPVAVGRFAEYVTNPTALEAALLDGLPAEFLLGASRFVPYKRLDSVIEMGNLTGTAVVIAGAGPDHERLRALGERSTVPVVFVDRPSHDLLIELYRRALAYVFPAIEDFGIMPVEAMACGTPVIGANRGGVAETVIDGVTGVLLPSFSSREDLLAAIATAEQLDRRAVRNRAQAFDEAVFDQHLREWVGASA